MELKIGTKLLVFVDSEDGKETLEMKSTLEGAGEDGRYLITAPIYQMRLHPIPAGEMLNIKIYDRSAILSLHAKVVKRVKKENLHYVIIQQYGKITRIQRREDFRLEVMLDATLDYIDPEDETEKTLRVHTSDISGGGVSIRGAIEFKNGDNVTIHLPQHGKQDKVILPCVVRRCFPIESAVKAYRYNIGLQFVHETQRAKENMIQYVFQLQREQSKGGKHR